MVFGGGAESRAGVREFRSVSLALVVPPPRDVLSRLLPEVQASLIVVAPEVLSQRAQAIERPLLAVKSSRQSRSLPLPLIVDSVVDLLRKLLVGVKADGEELEA